MSKRSKILVIIFIIGMIGTALTYTRSRSFLVEYASLKQQQAATKEALEGLKIEKELIELNYQIDSQATPGEFPYQARTEYRQKLDDIDRRIEAIQQDLTEKTAEIEKFGGPAKTAVVKLFKKFAQLVLS